MTIRILTIFALIALVGAACDYRISEAAEQDSSPLAMIEAIGCMGCHTIGKAGAGTAPDLNQIGSRMTVNQIINHLTADPASRTRGFMPSYAHLPQADLEAIAQYLYNLR